MTGVNCAACGVPLPELPARLVVWDRTQHRLRTHWLCPEHGADLLNELARLHEHHVGWAPT